MVARPVRESRKGVNGRERARSKGGCGRDWSAGLTELDGGGARPGGEGGPARLVRHPQRTSNERVGPQGTQEPRAQRRNSRSQHHKPEMALRADTKVSRRCGWASLARRWSAMSGQAQRERRGTGNYTGPGSLHISLAAATGAQYCNCSTADEHLFCS
jgi:hypothetical protein